MFTAGPAKEITVRQLDRLVLDRAQNSVGQSLWLVPGLPGILGRHQHSPPCVRTGADLVEQKQWSCLWLKQNGIPAGITLHGRFDTVRNFNGRRPLAFDQSRQPDTDVGILFLSSTEPGCYQSILGFDNR